MAQAEPLTAAEAVATAEAEGLTLQRSGNNQSGFRGSQVYPGCPPKPFEARVTRGGTQVSLGSFATAEEAALQYARTPESRQPTTYFVL